MSDYSDEEQLKRLQAWWAQNGIAVVGGAVIGLGAIFGWRAWQDHKVDVAETASSVFAEVQTAVQAEDVATAAKRKNTLQDDFKGTPYAGLAAVVVAKAQFADKDYAAAAENLDWARQYATDDAVRYLARLRLARVRWAEGDPSAGLRVLTDGEVPTGYVTLYKELEGDLLLAQGKTDEARAAYYAAQAADDGSRRAQLAQKIQDVAPFVEIALGEADAEPASDEAAAESGADGGQE